jgi:sulfur carrier protein
METMEIVVNGESRQIPPQTSLQDLICSLDLKQDRVAVELNRQIVRRERWAETQLHDQDRMEIVQFVGGG